VSEHELTFQQGVAVGGGGGKNEKVFGGMAAEVISCKFQVNAVRCQLSEKAF
jgi:hypothetical protein